MARGGTVGGTDQYYHRAIIEAIRANGHRFVARLNFVAPVDLAYPQLLHWVLSYVRPSSVDRAGRYLGAFFHLLSGIALLLSVRIVASFAALPVALTPLLWWTGIAYALTPYHYDVRNAKNVSISARGLGLFLGQAFVYAVVLYRVTGSLWFVAATVPLAWLMFVSSQFAMQFLLFATPVLSVYYRDPILLIAPAAGVLLFVALTPRIAMPFFRGQWGHKRLYATYLAERFILAARYSVWRDFVLDFWRGGGRSLQKRLGYVLSNPIVVVLTSMPLVVPVAVWLVARATADARTWGLLYELAGPLFAALAVFFATSFRVTRFLGEPERYVEFAAGIVALLAAIAFAGSLLLVALLAWSCLWMVAQVAMYRRIGRSRREEFYGVLEPFRDRLTEIARTEEVRLMSNNTQAAKVFFSNDLKLLWISLQTEHTGSFHFTRVFPESYNYMAEEVVVPIAREFAINYIVLDTRYAPRFEEEASAAGLAVTPLATAAHYRLLRIA